MMHITVLWLQYCSCGFISCKRETLTCILNLNFVGPHIVKTFIACRKFSGSAKIYFNQEKIKNFFRDIIRNGFANQKSNETNSTNLVCTVAAHISTRLALSIRGLCHKPKSQEEDARKTFLLHVIMASLTSRGGKKLKDAQEQDDSSSIRLSKLKRHVELRQLLVLVGIFAVVSSGLFLFFILFRDNYSSVTTLLPNQSAELLSDEKLQAIRGMLLEEATPATMYRYNPEHLGVAPPDSHYYHQPGRPPRLAQTQGYSFVWKTAQLNQDTYSASKSSPAIQGDLVYIGTDRTTLAAVSRLTGQVCKHHLRAPLLSSLSLSLSLLSLIHF